MGPSAITVKGITFKGITVKAITAGLALGLVAGSAGACQRPEALRALQPGPGITPAPLPATRSPSNGVPPPDYRERLRATPYGWPTLASWCVWIEPGATTGPAALWDQRWLGAVDAALASWEQVLPMRRAQERDQAHILIWRRKPRLQNNRASHGRAELELVEVKRSGQWQIEPLVTVAISPGQAQTAIQATALHELGHAFGLWGHSDQASDVMAVSPGAKPLLQLSARDRATLGWLYRQQGLNSGGVRPAAGPALPAPGAN